jgi:hypothetical protein
VEMPLTLALRKMGFPQNTVEQAEVVVLARLVARAAAPYLVEAVVEAVDNKAKTTLVAQGASGGYMPLQLEPLVEPLVLLVGLELLGRIEILVVVMAEPVAAIRLVGIQAEQAAQEEYLAAEPVAVVPLIRGLVVLVD